MDILEQFSPHTHSQLKNQIPAQLLCMLLKSGLASLQIIDTIRRADLVHRRKNPLRYFLAFRIL